MLNITTFLDANARRLDKDVFYCPTRDLRYNSGEVLTIVSGIGQFIKSQMSSINIALYRYIFAA